MHSLSGSALPAADRRLLALCLAAMGAGLWLDTQALPSHAIATLCAQARGPLDSARLHLLLLPQTSALMVVAAAAAPLCALKQGLRPAFARLWCGVGMLLGMLLALPAATLLPRVPGLAPMIIAMAAGMVLGALAAHIAWTRIGLALRSQALRPALNYLICQTSQTYQTHAVQERSGREHRDSVEHA